jgi:hypothetical protein
MNLITEIINRGIGVVRFIAVSEGKNSGFVVDGGVESTGFNLSHVRKN